MQDIMTGSATVSYPEPGGVVFRRHAGHPDRVRRAEIQMWISMVYSVIPHVSPVLSSDFQEGRN
jgi:hypothetical protein